MAGLRSLVPMAHVASVPRSIAFYRRLGFEVGNSFTPSGQVEPTWAWLHAAGAHLMVTQAGAPVDPGQQAVLFYLYADDLPAYRAELQKNGVEAGEVCYPFYAPGGEFGITDPDGYALMVTHTR